MKKKARNVNNLIATESTQKTENFISRQKSDKSNFRKTQQNIAEIKA